MDPRSESHGSDAELLSSIPIMKTMYGLFHAYSTNPEKNSMALFFKIQLLSMLKNT
jgi:hypothetical protein